MSIANIVLMGKTGVGKSSLVNSVFKEELVETGKGRPITEEIKLIEKDGIPLRIYDTRGLELKSETQSTAIEDIKRLLKEKAKSNRPDEYIHYIWYCVNSRSNRIEEYEIELIKKLSYYVEIILVFTQSLGDNWKELNREVEENNLPVLKTIPIMAIDYEINDEQKIEAFGLDELIEVSLNNIDRAVKKASSYSDFELVEDKANKAKEKIKKYSKIAFITGLTPIPFQDAFLLVPNQIAMINKINKIVGINLDKESIKLILTGLTGTLGATVTGKTIVSNALKFIPGVGTIAGGTISASTAAILTAALGYAYIEVASTVLRNQYLQKELDIEEFSNLLKNKYIEYLKKGKKLIKMDK
ncbi:MAG: DUF697 domain-containing protein [Andreesenia angusta]|nr:DUF697 domain-containing protein [Andreesenia angusta]